MFAVCLVLLFFAQTLEGFRILQISDFHFDRNYSTQGDTSKMCHSAVGRTNRVFKERLGGFGNYRCDAPWRLVKSALDSASRMFPSPELIVWTGDNVPHVEDYSQEYLLEAIQKTTAQMRLSFPGVQVLPTYGNHDHSPPNQFREDDELYEKTWHMWKDWIGEDAKETFLKGAYYRFVRSETLFLVLNTNLYYVYDNVTFKNPKDPADQFQFMRDQLSKARSSGTPVNIVGHISPGVYERNSNFKWFFDQYNAEFLSIVSEYHDVIKTMMFGHHHTDTFHLVRDENNAAVQVCWIGPAVTPWYSELGGAANNPAFRVYHFNSTKNWKLEDIQTFYVNLTKLNTDKKTEWELEYSFRRTYQLEDFEPSSLDRLLDRMDKEDSVYLTYLNYNTVLYKPETVGAKINVTKRRGHMCSLRYANFPQYDKCMKSLAEDRRSLIPFLFLIFIVFFLGSR